MTTASSVDVASRRNAIVTIVGNRGHVVIADLAAELGVSEMTVRRDVARLDDENRVVTFHGGVRTVELHPGAFGLRMQHETVVKDRIALQAASLVTPDAVVAIDAGSTAAILARHLTSRVGLRVVTASVPVISAFANIDGVELVALGGTLRRETQSFIGPTVTAAARDLQVETYFLGAAGLSVRGAFDVTDLDAVVKRELLGIARRVVAMADSTKFARRALSRICGWDAIDILITDDRIEAEALAMLSDLGVEVICVETT